MISKSDVIIKYNKDFLKEILNIYEKELNNRNFDAIYRHIERLPYEPCKDKDRPASFTALLLKNGINPLDYMNYVPQYFAYDLYIESFEIPKNIQEIGVCAFGYCGNLKIYIPNSVIHIGEAAFLNCHDLTVYYEGSEEDWENIEIDFNNDTLLNATIHYNS